MNSEQLAKLKELKTLLDNGILTQEEVEREKQKILQESEQTSPGQTITNESGEPPVQDDGISASKRNWFLICLAVAALLTCLAVYFTNRESENNVDEFDWEEYGEAAEDILSVPQTADSQNVFTVVYATSDDGFLNVRSEPSNNGAILTRLEGMFGGHGDGILLEKGESWSKVSVNGIIGWCYNKYLGYQTWYTGTGAHTLVSLYDNTPIYGDDPSGEGHLPVFARVGKGVIIADDYAEFDGYYVLVTADYPLQVSKNDVSVR